MERGEENDGNEAVDPNVIRMRVENVIHFTGSKRKTKVIDGFLWHFDVSRLGDALLAYVACNKEECEMWACETELEVKKVNRFDYSRSVCQKLRPIFKFAEPLRPASYICVMRKKWSSVIEDENIVVDGSIVFEIKIVVKRGNGDRFRTKPSKPDFFSTSKFSDGILCVEGKKLHVSKQILAHASTYFESLFFGDFKERQEKEIVLGEISAKEFLTTLEFIYDAGEFDSIDLNSDRNVDSSSNVEFLLKMADRFDIPKIMISAEERMMKTCRGPWRVPYDTYLLRCDQYKLYALQALCSRRISIQNSDVNDGNNGESSTIRIRVENVKDLSIYGVKSDVVRINEFPWLLKVYRNENSQNLHVIIQCNKSLECPFWLCEVEGKVKLINHNDSNASLCQSFVSPFREYGYYHDHSHDVDVCKWDIIGENAGLVHDGSIEVEVMINVKGRSGDSFRKNSQANFFVPSRFSDVVFLVEGKKMHASKQILAHSSSYFEKLFYIDLDVYHENEIVLDDVSAEEFLIALEMIYDTRRQCNDSNVEFLLKMVARFEITVLWDRAEKWLIGNAYTDSPLDTKLAIHSKLRLADQYKLETLKVQCLYEIKDFEQVKGLTNSDSYIHYSSELKDDLIKKMIELNDASEQRHRAFRRRLILQSRSSSSSSSSS